MGPPFCATIEVPKVGPRDLGSKELKDRGTTWRIGRLREVLGPLKKGSFKGDVEIGIYAYICRCYRYRIG